MTSLASILACLPILASTPRQDPGQAEGTPAADLGPLVLTVVEAGTGAPIPDAQVYEVIEAPLPRWGRFEHARNAFTDERGQVSFEGTKGGWFVVKAPGFGVRGELVGSPLRPIGLTREVPITVEVLDYLGRPIPLAHLGVAVGCGHTPDVLSTTTGPDGRATLRGVSPNDGIVDLYIVHPDLARNYYEEVPFELVREDGVARVYTEPGSKLEGQVLYPDGSPAVGLGVGIQQVHRGPWTTTDERGHFILFGMQPKPRDLWVQDPHGKMLAVFANSRAGCWRVLTISRSQPESKADYEPESLKVEGRAKGMITVQVAIRGGSPQEDVQVEVWNPQTGWCDRGRTDSDGEAILAVPAGSDIRVEVGGLGTPFEAQGLGLHRLEDGAALTLRAELPEPRVATLRLLGVRAKGSVAIHAADGAELALAGNAIAALEPNEAGHTVVVEDVTLPTGPWTVAMRPPSRSIATSEPVFPRSQRNTEDGIEFDFRPAQEN